MERFKVGIKKDSNEFHIIDTWVSIDSDNYVPWDEYVTFIDEEGDGLIYITRYINLAEDAVAKLNYLEKYKDHYKKDLYEKCKNIILDESLCQNSDASFDNLKLVIDKIVRRKAKKSNLTHIGYVKLETEKKLFINI